MENSITRRQFVGMTASTAAALALGGKAAFAQPSPLHALGANTMNITPKDVNFLSNNINIAAHLYQPLNPPAGKQPAIVVSHPGSGVKEQTAGLYAKRLAEKGWLVLTFDAAYQGASGGEPRGLEDPFQRVEDIKSAVSYLISLPEVDAERIGVLGICASGGYASAAAATDLRIKALATVSGMDINIQFRLGPDGKQDPTVFQDFLKKSAEARTAEAQGKGVQTFTLFPPTIEEARALGGDQGYEGFEYYCTPRGMHERSMKQMVWSSLDRIAVFDAYRYMDLLGERPVVMFVGTRAITAWISEDALKNVKGPKELVWIEGASHVDLYDKEPYVTDISTQLNAFFKKNLA